MRAYININAVQLEENYKIIKKNTNKDIIAVIKSNAYGHGLIECASILSKLSPKMFAVATFDEAINIRKSLIFTPILLLSKCVDVKTCYYYKITLSIVSIEHLKIVANSSVPIMIHLLLDTGMNRDGIRIDELEEALSIIKKSNLILKGIFTHFSSLNNYEKQNKIFEDALTQLPAKNLIIHSQATSTMLLQNEKTTAIRVGLALYGLAYTELGLKPILSLKAPIIRESAIKKGESVGYEESEIAKSDGYVLTIGIGYADGLCRNRRHIGYIGDDYVAQIGNICMDQLMFFSETSHPNGVIELLGEHISVNGLAKVYKTIPYELVAHLASRLKRHLTSN